MDIPSRHTNARHVWGTEVTAPSNSDSLGKTPPSPLEHADFGNVVRQPPVAPTMEQGKKNR